MNLAHELVLAEEVALEYPTYPVGQPEKHPLFFEKRVYQGSNGKVYPLPARFQFKKAIEHLLKAIERLSDFHPNPITGEAHYYCGLAFRFSGEDRLAEIAYEHDQLRKKLGDAPDTRLARLENKLEVVLSRDDFCVEYLCLLNLKERHTSALKLMAERRFQPFSGKSWNSIPLIMKQPTSSGL